MKRPFISQVDSDRKKNRTTRKKFWVARRSDASKQQSRGGEDSSWWASPINFVPTLRLFGAATYSYFYCDFIWFEYCKKNCPLPFSNFFRANLNFWRTFLVHYSTIIDKSNLKRRLNWLFIISDWLKSNFFFLHSVGVTSNGTQQPTSNGQNKEDSEEGQVMNNLMSDIQNGFVHRRLPDGGFKVE